LEGVLMIQTTKTSTEMENLKVPEVRSLSKGAMREWAFEKIREIGLRLNDAAITVPIEAYIQTIEQDLGRAEERLAVSERASETLFTKLIIAEAK